MMMMIEHHSIGHNFFGETKCKDYLLYLSFCDALEKFTNKGAAWRFFARTALMTVRVMPL